jgi:hypothetical protein
MMASDRVEDSNKHVAAMVMEDSKKVVDVNIRHYLPVSDEEKALDRKVNLKCDFVILLVLAINFIVCIEPHLV